MATGSGPIGPAVLVKASSAWNRAARSRSWTRMPMCARPATGMGEVIEKKNRPCGEDGTAPVGKRTPAISARSYTRTRQTRPLGGTVYAGDLKSSARKGVPVRVREGLLHGRPLGCIRSPAKASSERAPKKEALREVARLRELLAKK